MLFHFFLQSWRVLTRCCKIVLHELLCVYLPPWPRWFHLDDVIVSSISATFVMPLLIHSTHFMSIFHPYIENLPLHCFLCEYMLYTLFQLIVFCSVDRYGENTLNKCAMYNRNIFSYAGYHSLLLMLRWFDFCNFICDLDI